LIFYIIT